MDMRNIGIQLKRHMKSVYETFVILVTNVINHLIKKRHVQFDHVDIFIVTPRHFGGGEKKAPNFGFGQWEGVLPDPYIIII